MGMSRPSSQVDQKQFDTNFYHVLYVLVYAVFNHSLLGKLFLLGTTGFERFSQHKQPAKT